MKSRYQVAIKGMRNKRKKFKNRTNKRWIKERRRIDRKELRN